MEFLLLPFQLDYPFRGLLDIFNVEAKFFGDGGLVVGMGTIVSLGRLVSAYRGGLEGLFEFLYLFLFLVDYLD